MESILNSIKKLLGLAEDYEAFDADVIMNINSAFFTLWQLGVGPKDGPFTIGDKSKNWNDFIDPGKIEMCKMYVYYTVRLGFDPPANSFLVTMINEKLKEYEWRMMVGMDEYNSKEE